MVQVASPASCTSHMCSLKLLGGLWHLAQPLHPQTALQTLPDTCFTSTKAQNLDTRGAVWCRGRRGALGSRAPRKKARRQGRRHRGTQSVCFTYFTLTKAQMLTQKVEEQVVACSMASACASGTTVQHATQLLAILQVLTLLAFLALLSTKLRIY